MSSGRFGPPVNYDQAYLDDAEYWFHKEFSFTKSWNIIASVVDSELIEGNLTQLRYYLDPDTRSQSGLAVFTDLSGDESYRLPVLKGDFGGSVLGPNNVFNYSLPEYMKDFVAHALATKIENAKTNSLRLPTKDGFERLLINDFLGSQWSFRDAEAADVFDVDDKGLLKLTSDVG